MHVYEKHPYADAYRIGWSYVPYASIAVEKRLTDAELAAEFHKSTSDFMSANSMHMIFDDAETEKTLNDSRDWMFAMERFATRPHYDEADV